MTYWLIVAGIVAFGSALILTPLVRDVALILGLVDRPNGRKIHVKPVPRIGGVAIALSILLSYAVLHFVQNDDLIRSAWINFRYVFPAACIVFLAGLWDDFFGLRPWYKLFWIVVASLVAIHYTGIRIAMLAGHPMPDVITIPLTLLWLLVCSNAFNLIDGLDGLAAGIGLFATITTLLAALTHQNTELALLTVPLVGALLGFLRYNFNPASIFLGDCGSLTLGFLLGCYAVLWSQKSATILGMTAPLMAFAIPLVDAMLAITRRFLRHQPIFAADGRHIHHRLLDLGLTPRRAALSLYAVCGVGAACSLLAHVDGNRFGGIVILLFCLGAWVGVQHLGYAEYGAASRMLLRFRRMVDQDVKLRIFESELSRAGDAEAVWHALLRGSGAFGFERVRMILGGRIYDSGATGIPLSRLWQVHMPLQGGDGVTFFRGLNATGTPALDFEFVIVVESTLTRIRTTLLANAPERPPMMPAPSISS